jgi:hypothetical protein
MIRAYIRHPIDVPIELSEPLASGDKAIEAEYHRLRATNISSGGVSIMSDRSLPTNSIIQISIPLVRPVFRTYAQVVWCKKLDSAYELGLQFMHYQDEFAARMVEQVCHIEHYKKQVLHEEGRRLTTEAAAQEWIGKYAHQFPTISH